MKILEVMIVILQTSLTPKDGSKLKPTRQTAVAQISHKYIIQIIDKEWSQVLGFDALTKRI